MTTVATPDELLATCQRKRPYPSQQNALNAAWLRGIVTGLRIYAYPCRAPGCGCWHITTSAGGSSQSPPPIPVDQHAHPHSRRSNR